MTPKFSQIQVGDKIQFNITVPEINNGYCVTEHDICTLSWQQAKQISEDEDGDKCCMIIFNWFDNGTETSKKYQDDGPYQYWMYNLLPNCNTDEPIEGCNMFGMRQHSTQLKILPKKTFTITSLNPFTYV